MGGLVTLRAPFAPLPPMRLKRERRTSVIGIVPNITGICGHIRV